MAQLDLTYLTTNVSSEPEFIREILTVFLDSLPRDKKDLEDAIKAEIFENIKRAAHKMKSSFRSLGFAEAASQLETIENLAKNASDLDDIKKAMGDFEEGFPQMVKNVKTYLENN
jgi:HPt (histidine-containing phosphotransfer) domain-containing protein